MIEANNGNRERGNKKHKQENKKEKKNKLDKSTWKERLIIIKCQ